MGNVCMTFSKRYQEIFLRKLFLVLKNKWNVICVCAYGDEKAEPLRVQMLATAELSGAFPAESYLAPGLPPGARSCRLLKRSGLPLSSRLKHMLNLHSDILPRRGARFSVNQADLTQRQEHILPGCHDAGVENTFSEFLSKVRSRLIRTGVGRRGTAEWVGARSGEASGTEESSALGPGTHSCSLWVIVRINRGNTCEAFSLMPGTW